MFTLHRTDSTNPDFVALVHQLDAFLAIRNGDRNDFFVQYNKIDLLRNVIIGYWDDTPVACGAFKPFDEDSVEIKRMFVLPHYRNRGLAAQVLAGLEAWARETGWAACVLETGTMIPEAIQLYYKQGYTDIPKYGQYVDVETSVCMRKVLTG